MIHTLWQASMQQLSQIARNLVNRLHELSQTEDSTSRESTLRDLFDRLGRIAEPAVLPWISDPVTNRP